MFSASNDIVIGWNNIKCIGEDVILVEIEQNQNKQKLKKWENNGLELAKITKKKLLIYIRINAIINKESRRKENN